MADLVSVDTREMQRLSAELRAMAKRCTERRPLMARLAGIVEFEIQENFAAGGRDPKWEPSRRVKKEGGQTLIRSSRLLNSLTEFSDNDSAGAGVSAIYGPIHNFGGIIRRYARSEIFTRKRGKNGRFRKGTKAGRGFTIGEHDVTMPKREFAKVSKGGFARIETAVANYISGGQI